MQRDEPRWERVHELFDRALSLSPGERRTLLDSEGPEVRSAVERLLSIDASAEDALERGVLRARADDALWAGALTPGQEVDGRRLLRALGAGGMGIVFEAEELDPPRRVALKTLRAELFTPDLVRRFANEVRVLARLEHPNIARILATGSFERAGEHCPYYTMELVEDAATIVRHASRAELDERARIELFLQASDAVEHGHQKGVIHRDLKPGNLLVDPRGRLKVIDFGLARPVDAPALGGSLTRTRAGLVLGTLPYMSPEHVVGRPLEIDVQSDVFSLGCILCELLTGRTPHELCDVPLRTALERIEQDDPRAPSELPRELAWIVERACARERGRRYSGADALSADLRRYLRREPVEAAPPSRAYAARTFARRHRGLLAATGAVIAALAIGLVTTAREARRTERALAAAAQEAAVGGEVSRFLSSVFFSVSPFGAGRDARMSDALPYAESRLALVEREDARAILMAELGRGYLDLGDLERAEHWLSRATGLASEHFAPASPYRLRVEIAWADALEQLGRYGESRALTADVLARGRDVLDVDDHYHATVNLAVCESRLGDHASAERRLRALLEDELERKHSWVAAISLKRRIAGEVEAQGRSDEARALYEEVLAMHAKLPRGSELIAATARVDLAQLLVRDGELEEAERLLDESVGLYDLLEAPPFNRAQLALARMRIELARGDVPAAEAARGEAARHAEEVADRGRLAAELELADAALAQARGSAPVDR